jgi:hypothetical protein
MSTASVKGPQSIAASRLDKSPVFDLYWRFAAERQAIFKRRLEGERAPWTDDPILRDFRFTNAYRASDRVSQHLIRSVIYDGRYPSSPAETAFRVLLFKFFNKESTWTLLERKLGLPTWQSFDRASYDEVLTEAAAAGTRLYSAAYIIPPVAIEKSGVKHRGHLKLLEAMLEGDFVSQLQSTGTLEEAFQLLKGYPSLGPFLAFQLAIDLNYSTLTNHDEREFVVPGPGARDGIAKVFPNAKAGDAEAIIHMMAERQEEEFASRGIDFQSLWGRRLQPIDCQNLFCEISKYTRVSHPEIAGLSGRTRIKQAFRPAGPPVQPWYPPKWNLNDRIPKYRGTRSDELFSQVDP